MSRLAEQLVVSAAGQGVQLTGESGLLTAVAGDRPGALPDLRRPPGSQLSQPCQTQTIRQTPGSFTRGVRDELGYKPGSVRRPCHHDQPATIYLGLPLPTGSCGLPADSGGPPSNICAAPEGAF